MAREPSAAQQAIGDIAPKLVQLTDDVLFGDVCARPGLSPRDRSLITVGVLVALYRGNELPGHLRRALANGVTRDELIELITHLAFYAVWPSAMSAMRAARDRLVPSHAERTTAWPVLVGTIDPHTLPRAHQDCYDRDAMAPLPPSEHSLEDPHRAVVACAKQAILDGDRSGALALLRVLLNNGPELAATLTPVLAEALIATARDELDAEDQLARDAFDEARAARDEICRLLQTAPLDTEDLATIRLVLDSRDHQLQDEEQQRMAEQRAGASPETVRLGLGWLERYWVARRWGPYIRARWRQQGRKRMKYIGRIAE